MTRTARFTLVAAAAAATMATAAAPAAASHARCRLCNPPGSQTLTADEFGRVYTVRAPQRRRVVACSYASGRRHSLKGLAGPGRAALGEDGPNCVFQEHLISQVRLAGGLVGYVRIECGLSLSSKIVVRDLRTGRALYSEPATEGPGADPTSTVTDFELKPTGSTVWIADHDATDTDSGIDDRQVRVIEARLGQHPITRASGLDIEAGSLAMVRRESIAGTNPFYWRQGGEVRSSSLD